MLKLWFEIYLVLAEMREYLQNPNPLQKSTLFGWMATPLHKDDQELIATINKLLEKSDLYEVKYKNKPESLQKLMIAINELMVNKNTPVTRRIREFMLQLKFRSDNFDKIQSPAEIEFKAPPKQTITRT